MSTTDTRAAFEAWAINNGMHDLTPAYGTGPDHGYMRDPLNICWEVWQAATEAAKATGTAGELPELPQCFGSIDVYHDSGQVTSVDGWTADQMRGYAIDYAMQLGLAARQPAPSVFYQQEFLRWNRAQEKPPVAISKEMGVAAKAVEFYLVEQGQPAPVALTDEKIISMSKAFGELWGNSDDEWIIDFARHIIAENRSQS